jgi:HlyD family secretion protein
MSVKEKTHPATGGDKTMKRRSRKWIWIVGGVLAVLLVGGYFGLSRLRDLRDTMLQGGTGEIVTAFIGDLSARATASGQVVARRESSLAAASAGTIAQVYVGTGDAVQAGDPLVALETGELERAVESARQALARQEANLASLQAPPSASDLAAADAAVLSAQAALDDLLAGPADDELIAAQASLEAAQADLASARARLAAATAPASPEAIQAAQIELQLAQQDATHAAEQHRTILVTEPQGPLTEERLAEMEFSARTAAVQANARLAAAQEALDALLNGDPNAVAAARAGVALAEAKRDSAQAQLDLLQEGASGAQIASARATLAQAEANRHRLVTGPSASQLETAEVAVEQARIILQRAENDLSDATLCAPFDGVVTAVHAAEGEAAAGVLVEIFDTASLEVVLDVDEVDVGDITVGEPAAVTLEAWPDVALSGRVASIAPRASGGTGAIVSYQVSLSLDPADLPVRVGMTANASLTTATRQGVLLLPNAAINVDRTAGTYSVNLLRTDAGGRQTVEEVRVAIGLRDGDFTQITSGLQEGDQVVIGEPSALITFGPGAPGHPDVPAGGD